MASVVQSSANNNGAGATTVVVTLSATGAGRFLSLMAGCRGAPSRSILSVSDNINGTTGWVIKNPSGTTPDNPDFLANAKPAFAYHLNPGAGVTTVTVTLDASGVAGVFVSEINPGTATPSYLGHIIGANGNAAVTNWTSNALAISAGQAICVHGISSAGTTGLTYTAGASFTALAGTNITSGSNTNATDVDQIFGEFRDIASSGTSIAADGTSTSTTQNSGALIFLLTPAAAPSGTGGSKRPPFWKRLRSGIITIAR